jgi:hypothetical protein
MAGVAVSATDVVAPVLAASKVVMFLSARVAAQARFRDLFRSFIFEGDDLLRIAFLTVGFAWTMAGFATGHFLLPTADLDELSVGSLRERFELVFVTILASVATYVIFRLIGHGFGMTRLNRVRRTVGTQPTDARSDEGTDQECFDELIQI